MPHELESIIIRKFTADYDVLSRDALGATTIRLTLRTMTSDRTMKSEGSISKHWLADSTSVDGTPLTIKQSREGKIWGVVGLRAFQRKILETDGIGDLSMIDTLLDPDPLTGRSDMIKSLSEIVGTSPVSPVRVGESWNYDMSSPQSLALDISGTRTLKSLNSEVAVINDSVSYQGKKSRQELANMPQSDKIGVVFTHLKGSINSVSRVQRSSGLSLEKTMNQTVKGGILVQTPAFGGGVQNESEPFNYTISRRVVLEPR